MEKKGADLILFHSLVDHLTFHSSIPLSIRATVSEEKSILNHDLQHALETESPPLHGSSRVHESMELSHSNFQRENSKWNK